MSRLYRRIELLSNIAIIIVALLLGVVLVKKYFAGSPDTTNIKAISAGTKISLPNVDWSKTRAYGLGLNGLYVNLRGREREGIVEPGAQADALLREIKEELLRVRDPQNKVAAITRVDRASEVYQGPYAQQGPDLLVGYNRGYRAGWQTILGNFPAEIFEDNTNPWSGDHCMDYTLVPGVLLSNQPIQATNPALTDIAPTILAEFGIPKPHGMMGHSVFASSH